VKQGRHNFMGIVSTREHLSMTCYHLLFVNNPPWTFDGNVYAS
jgi:hypothetical protein